MDRESAAYKLYRQGTKKGELARIFKVNNDTITSWAKKGKWDEKLEKDNLFQETASDQVKSLITYNLTILNKIKDKKLAVLKDDATIEELENALTSRGDVDALQKLFTTIKGKELPWETTTKAVRSFMEYLDGENPKIAQKVVEYAHDFIDTKRKEA